MRNRMMARQILLVTVLVIGGIGHGNGQEAPSRGLISTRPAESDLWWPLPPSAKAYGTIDGRHLKTYVEQLAAIARKSREGGNQFWGRISGTPASEETQQWVAAKLKHAGLDVRMEPLVMGSQKIPRSWEVTVAGGGNTVKLTSAWPILGTTPTPEGGQELDTVWAGLGMPSDFIGRDVRGKAVFLYSVPTPGSFNHSAEYTGAVTRARDLGAAAVVIVLALPGNMSYAAVLGSMPGRQVPMFSVGLDDGLAVESLTAASASGRAPTARLRLKIDTVSGLKAANVVGVLAGQTDENIVVMAHTDGYFEGANDNASGVATFVGLAEYYAKLPKEQRRRSIYFVASPSHHGGGQGAKWMHDNMKTVFAKTAVIVNPEHTSVMQTYYDSTEPALSSPRPTALFKSNAVGASWFGVNGSDRLSAIVVKAFALFGVPTETTPRDVAGDMRPIQYEAPSIFLMNKGPYYHSSMDSPDIVLPSGLEAATRAFAKILDDVNQLELRDLRPTAAPTTASR